MFVSWPPRCPIGYVFTAMDTTADDSDSDAAPTTGETISTTLVSAEYDPTWDAGIYLPPAAIGDRVWYDNDRDGMQIRRTGGGNLTVVLLDRSGAVLSTTVTDGSGSYIFRDLQPGGFYSLRFVTSTLPLSHHQPNAVGDDAADSDADPATGATVLTTLDVDEYDPTWDMGIYLPPATMVTGFGSTTIGTVYRMAANEVCLGLWYICST